MEIKKIHLIGIAIGLAGIIISLFFLKTKIFFLIIGVSVFVVATPFVVSVIRANKIDEEKEEMFLEFARNLVESAKTGIPISQSIINVRHKPYGALSEHISKLANQIQLGISLNKAFETFAKDAGNKTISRALTLMGNAEKAGGDIGEILESVAEAVSLSEKLKKERKAAISNIVIEGYLIFIIFIAIVLVMQFKILPMLSGIAGTGFMGGGGGSINAEELSNAFLYLLLTQGFFSGLTIGKLAENSIKKGIRHSFFMMIVSFFIFTGINVIWG